MAVHVDNIPHIADEEDLLEVLERFLGVGTISSCKILLHPDSARSKGFGFVDFKEKEVAAIAVKLSREEKLKLHNRVLTLKIHERPAVRGAKSELFSIEHGKLSMGCLTAKDAMYSIWHNRGPLILEISPENQTLSFQLELDKKKDKNVWNLEYKMEFQFNEISELAAVQVDSKSGFLLQVKESPPYLYSRSVAGPPGPTGDAYVDMIESYQRRNVKKTNEDGRSWVRTTDFTPNCIGQCFAFAVEIRGPEAEFLRSFLDRTGIYNATFSKLRMERGKPYAVGVVVPLLNPMPRVAFDVLYKINNLVQRGKLSGPTLEEGKGKFFKMIKDTQHSAVVFALQAMSGLESTCYEPVKYLKELLDEYKKGIQPPLAKLEGGTVMIHRVLVTPTKVYCMGPEPEKSNRIIRQYEKFSSHFLRVNFVDENCSPLMSSTLMSELHTSRSNVFKRIQLVLKEGICIGDRNYQFLAFSASQLREGQLWMYATPTKEVAQENITAQDIRDKMGDFASIRNVAKCAARMGQCFSSSKRTKTVLPIQVKNIKDINVTTDSVTYCFSDGIGKISDAFARVIAVDCGFRDGWVPSAFQIRYGGYKGVVARDPTESSSFKLYLRPSMRKFDSPHLNLEVLEWTKALVCHLNRQVISLLSSLGVKDSAFLELQNRAVSKYERLLENDATAMEILREVGSDSMALKMLESGYASKTEPLLQRLLSVYKDAQLNELKQKARIPVERGRLLMGCLDETRTLQYGQIYVKYSPLSKTGEFTKDFVVTGKVFVAKNPCLHPGDIRILEAVDIPQLGHMVDCAVFPQSGPRPHPNECSGSDLDGDMYVVSWDKSLVPPTMDPPMDYTPPPTVVLDHPVQIEEIQEFFVNYMVNDNLGIISNAHVVHADKEPDSARNPKCLELAQLASMAVDFPKTGVPAIIPMDLRPREYPDFMEKEQKTVYASYGILGKLYRAINPLRSRFSLSVEDLKKCYDKSLIAPDYENYLESALTYKKQYDMKLMGIMNQFGIREEAEVVSGSVLSMSRMYMRRQVDSLPKVSLAFKTLQKEAKLWFKGPSTRVDPKEESAKASAWYHVTYHYSYFGHKDHSQYSEVTKSRIHLLSFPWVLSNELLNLKRNTTPTNSVQTAGESSKGLTEGPRKKARLNSM